MGWIKRVRIHSDEMGLRFREGEFDGLLEPGKYWFFDPLGKLEFASVSVRDPWLVHEKLDVIVKSGVLRDKAEVVDLKDHERALVWIDGRFQRVATRTPPLVTSDGIRAFASSASMEKSVLRGRIEG